MIYINLLYSESTDASIRIQTMHTDHYAWVFVLCLSLLAGILFLSIWSYRRHKKRQSVIYDQAEDNNGQELKDLDIPYNDEHGSIDGADVQPAIPTWLKVRSEMIYPPSSIKKEQKLGHGNYGTVFKGKLVQANAV